MEKAFAPDTNLPWGRSHNCSERKTALCARRIRPQNPFWYHHSFLPLSVHFSPSRPSRSLVGHPFSPCPKYVPQEHPPRCTESLTSAIPSPSTKIGATFSISTMKWSLSHRSFHCLPYPARLKSHEKFIEANPSPSPTSGPTTSSSCHSLRRHQIFPMLPHSPRLPMRVTLSQEENQAVVPS